ncbi:hypothetical protein I5M27_12575 [Adhaeribacter sp. BT258]|uniref:Uncharacterized protein n=1 Tax=Adhaeribacter terrigena TaxID=2793070 RepID=A0ABS1C353_9BACT|nr:hypothetical protein [Adhaeribacter terrigena]MBK0403827.1 hypothetical protein [Adhaeribacter terrigena]
MKAGPEFILQCNQNSFIEEVMYVREKLDVRSLVNQPLLFCISPEYLEAGRRFVEAIRWSGKAQYFDLEILLNDEKHLFTFSGVLLRDHIILVAQRALPKENPELPVTQLVAEEVENTLAEPAEMTQTENEAEVTVWELLEEMSRLNNELINTKRDLVRKSMELERLQEQLKKR